MSQAIRAITMPKWGLAMEEGMVVAWHVEEGATVTAGADLADIETTKITNVFESPAAGVLRRRVAVDGETVPVGALISVLADASVPEADIAAFIAAFNADFAVKAEDVRAEAPAPSIVEVAGRPINYLDIGLDIGPNTGEGEGTPVVLVHGFGGDLNNWMFNQAPLAEGRRVIALDLPGHGASSKEVGAGDLASLSGALSAWLDVLGVGRAHLVGHSLGGAVALGLARDRPDMVASLTLLAPAGLGTEINGAFIAGFVAAGRRREMKAVVEDLFATRGLASRELVDNLLKYKRLDGVEAALRRIAETMFPVGRQAIDLRPRLDDPSIPVQVIWGAEDRIIPAAQAKGLPAAIAVNLLDGVGHMAHMEAAGEVNRLIADFVG